jgi:hypothetical protein
VVDVLWNASAEPLVGESWMPLRLPLTVVLID